jgi:hypothetical protein
VRLRPLTHNISGRRQHTTHESCQNDLLTWTTTFVSKQIRDADNLIKIRSLTYFTDILCGMRDLRKPHYVSHEIWGNPITCHMRSEETPLRVTWDLRKPHYVSHEIWGNPITCHMLVSLSNIQSVAKLLCILQAIRLAKIGHNRIYHIIIYSWHRVSRMYPIMWLLQISHPVTCQ